MKRFLIVFALLLFISTAYADSLPKDGNGTWMQWPAFNGLKTSALTAAMPSKTNIDMRQDMFYSLYCAGVAKERTLPFGNYTASLKAAYVQSSVPATTWHTQAVNKLMPFLNISGCVGQLRRQ